MISPERLRYYPFFSGLSDAQIKAIAMIASQESYESGDILCQKGQAADQLYFLETGCVDLYYDGNGGQLYGSQPGIPVGEITPGEPFSISALIEPHILTATALATKPSRVIKIDAKALRLLCKKDKRLAYLLTKKAAKIAIERLHATRIQLVSVST